MGETPEARFDAADHHRDVAVGLLQTGGVDDSGAVGTCAVAVTRRVGVVATEFSRRGIVRDHGVHGAGRHGEEEARAPEGHERLLRAPVRLGNDAYPKPRRFEEAGQERHPEGGVVYVGVAGDEDHVQFVPAAGVCFAEGDREELGGGPLAACCLFHLQITLVNGLSHGDTEVGEKSYPD